MFTEILENWLIESGVWPLVIAGKVPISIICTPSSSDDAIIAYFFPESVKKSKPDAPSNSANSFVPSVWEFAECSNFNSLRLIISNPSSVLLVDNTNWLEPTVNIPTFPLPPKMVLEVSEMLSINSGFVKTVISYIANCFPVSLLIAA